ncbi:mitogen-activated protein kinase kinase kinase 3-like [Physella acuta]|uniref:mitogen-activated protein kinase kinase kinase 3-like n=1 Tax=Physella acuta TaxID=109671 RepID=UPI0027DC8059|nr:mitogen-activated protein kinase kinase kinase 3-like [Physella acuta]
MAIRNRPTGNLSAYVEIETMSKVSHHRILDFYGYSKTAHVLSIFFAFIEKGTLATYIKTQEERHLTERKTSQFTFQILEGLEYLHQKRIIHRDIKGSNILMQDDDNIKISDFGVAKILQTLSRANTKGTGTVNWMAPEVMSGGSYDNKVDIWSLGCTVYQMFTGKVPFNEVEDHTIILKMHNKALVLIPPDNCSKHLRKFLNSTCEIDPSRRPSATELLEHSFSTQEAERLLKGVAVQLQRNAIFGADVRLNDMYPELSAVPKPSNNLFASPSLLDTTMITNDVSNMPFSSTTTVNENNSSSDTKKNILVREEHTSRYASVVRDNWEKVFENLNFTPEEIVEEYEICSNDVNQTMNTLLLKWIEREGDEATHANLQEALAVTEEEYPNTMDFMQFARLTDLTKAGN